MLDQGYSGSNRKLVINIKCIGSLEVEKPGYLLFMNVYQDVKCPCIITLMVWISIRNVSK